jgi:hypothetical protein
VFERLRNALQIVLLMASPAWALAAQSYIIVDNQTGLISRRRTQRTRFQPDEIAMVYSLGAT